jgi:hypothetical protein
MSKKVRLILKKAIDIYRWAEKSDVVYTFLQEEEIEEITDNILKELDKGGYEIIPSKPTIVNPLNQNEDDKDSNI